MADKEPDDGFRRVAHGIIEMKCPACEQWTSILYIGGVPLLGTHIQSGIRPRFCAQSPYPVNLPERFTAKKSKKWWARSSRKK